MGKYLKLFDSHNGYTAYTADTENYLLPNVSYCEQEDECHFEGIKPPHNYAEDYLTFRATADGTFKLSGNSVDYSLDSGETWTELASNTNSPTVTQGGTIMFKASLTPTSSAGIGRFLSTANFEAEGNPMSLLYGDNFREQYSLSDKSYAFYRLFSGCTKLASAENLVLPATTLANNCYQYMFYNCSGLTTAPQLPATTLANNCYTGMFAGCTSLTSTPTLQATTLAEGCYQSMFSGCTSLTTAPQLLATTLAVGCYAQMFQDCTSLTTAPELPATTLANSCYFSMFQGCTSLATAPTLSATTLASYCYSYMFQGCTSLTTAPQLPATTLASNCYEGMFYGCTSLNYIKAMFTTTPSASYTLNWVYRVAANGTFVKNSAAIWTTTGVNGVPNGWTIETASS